MIENVYIDNDIIDKLSKNMINIRDNSVFQIIFNKLCKNFGKLGYFI